MTTDNPTSPADESTQEQLFPCALCGTDIDPYNDAYCIKGGVGPLCTYCIDDELGSANDDFEP